MVRNDYLGAALLIGGSGNFEGIVEVMDSNLVRGTICDLHFTDTDATVVCRMLGFKSG